MGSSDERFDAWRAGFAANDGKSANKNTRHYCTKIDKNRDDIVITESFGMEDADYAIITFAARSVRRWPR